MRNCECCGAQYTTGKDYGTAWKELPNLKKEFKGLCQFCNPNNKWFIKDKICHNDE